MKDNDSSKNNIICVNESFIPRPDEIPTKKWGLLEEDKKTFDTIKNVPTPKRK